jgi:pimeloyl-ACP methyl ester carboxylesterase
LPPRAWHLLSPPGAYGPELEGFEYSFTVERFSFSSQGRSVSMTFMDVAPNKPNGRTVVLLHGKNFCAATWDETIKALVEAGYRVIAPDQIGFCKSTKPEHACFKRMALSDDAGSGSRV